MNSTPSEAKVLVEASGHVLKIALNRPQKYNAYDLETHHLLARAYGRLDTDPQLRCAVVWGNGRHLTAGLDLPQWTESFGKGRWPPLADDERDPFGLIEDKRVGKPVVFAAQGICFTVAIELMLAADVRIAADDCRFGQIEVRRGIYACGGAPIRMVQEFGWGNAQRYLLTGDEFDAREALRIGLVQEVVPLGSQVERATALAEKIARQAPLGVYGSLKSSRLALEKGQRAALDRSLPDLAPIMKSEDVQEGVRSFVERREARFTVR
jgi:enoyl-CoA hydratase